MLINFLFAFVKLTAETFKDFISWDTNAARQDQIQ